MLQDLPTSFRTLLSLIHVKTLGEDGINPNQGSSKQQREELKKFLKVSGGLTLWSSRQSPLTPPPDPPDPPPAAVTGTSPGPQI